MVDKTFESEDQLVSRAQMALSSCNWTLGECAALWTKRYSKGRTDAAFGEMIGLSADQITKLKELQLNLDKNRIKMEADIQVAEREVKALTDDEKSDIGAIEAKLKQSADVQIGLRVLSVKTRRDALALLTPEQRAKEQAEHEKMMQQHKGMGAPHGKNPHGGNPHGANPHGEAKPQ